MTRLADFFTSIVNRYMPDPLVVAIILTFATALIAMVVQGTSPIDVVRYWGNDFWGLLAFTMQMTVILLAGYILAKTPIADRLMNHIVGRVHTPSGAIVAATLFGGIGSWLNWGFGLVVGTLVAQKLGQRVKGLHYPLVIAAGYSGFSIYGIGLSGSVPLLISTPGHFLQGTIGIVPLSETIFSPMLLITSLLVVATLPFFNVMLHPKRAEDILEAPPEKPVADLSPEKGGERRTVAEAMNNSPVLGIAIGAMGMLWCVLHLVDGGSITLNFVNFLFLFLGILLFASPSRYLAALFDGVRIVGGIIVQYPFYSGILGIMTGSGLIVSLSSLFVSISTAETLPLWAFVSGGLINIFVPSGGGQWVVQGPVMMEAARQIGASIPATALAVQVGDQWTNMVQPFWLLPALAISGLQLRHLMGYMVLVLLYLGVIFGLACLIWGHIGVGGA